MGNPEKTEYMQLEILKHVERNPKLNTRMAAAKLGCSVKLSHELLKRMVSKGLLQVKKLHARRWDYFLTAHGLAEKARLTYQFIEFSMQFYHEARKRSSLVCRHLVEKGFKKLVFLGAGDLAEIVYLGVKEWGLELNNIYDDEHKTFLGYKVFPIKTLKYEPNIPVIVCLYNPKEPMFEDFLPGSIQKKENMCWIF